MKNEKWQPVRFGERLPNEVVCYTVAIPNLPLFPDKNVKKFIKWIGELEGFIGFRPECPHGTILIFKTENDAKGARNLIRNYKGYEGIVGNNIAEVYVDKKYVEMADNRKKGEE